MLLLTPSAGTHAHKFEGLELAKQPFHAGEQKRVPASQAHAGDTMATISKAQCVMQNLMFCAAGTGMRHTNVIDRLI
jgi:hypothetical protein